MSSYQLIARPCPPVAAQLSEHISPLLARLYAARGVDSVEQLSLKLNRLIPAQQMKGLDCAVNLLDQAIANFGGFTGTQEKTKHVLTPHFSVKPYVYDGKPQRDERFHDSY